MQVVPRTLGRAPILVVDDDPKIVHLVRMYLLPALQFQGVPNHV